MKITAFSIRRESLVKFGLSIAGLALLLGQAMSISPAWADGGGLEPPDLLGDPAEVQDMDGDGNPFDGYGGAIYESHDGFTWHRTHFLEAGNGGFWDKINKGK